jgi:hypothetical protein
VKRPVAFLALALFLLPAVLLVYRIVWLGYPVLPTAPGRTWQLIIDVRARTESPRTKIALALPRDHAGSIVVEERVSSGAYAFNLLTEGANRIGVWSGSTSRGTTEVQYQATILSRPARQRETHIPAPRPYLPSVEKEDQALAERLTRGWSKLPIQARFAAITEALKGNWGLPPPDAADLNQWKVFQEKLGKLDAILTILRSAGLSARRAEGIELVEGIQTAPLQWIEVWTGQGWETLLPETGTVYDRAAPLLPLAVGNFHTANVTDGGLLDIRWILDRRVMSQWRLHYERIIRSNQLLDRLSLFHLPQEFQQTFHILLLVPIGALLICVLRNIVGFPTFGIFMPVLMALAFRSTGLIYGLGIFAGVLLIGYLARRWVNNFNLLLVPRMSFMLTLVIGVFTVLAIVGNRLGIREVMAVGLLPFVILTMTIERFFILIEEAGATQALITSGGSAAVSIITYGIISWESLQLTFFVFPELILVVAALQVLIGRYTGYRLSEFIRFRTFGGEA